MAKFQSTKLFDGYSTCFRQWKAEDTHCKFLHGYAVSFRVWFDGDLDHRNWVWDFGGMKRSKGKIADMSPKDYFAWLLDHTTIVAVDDPYLKTF
jgi:6-pyruvoyltetrahydropterin/6-carboxytetrahydropterin synthase